MKKINIYGFIICFTALFTPVFANFSDHTDIPSWAEPSIYDLQSLGVIEGNPDGTIRPNSTINRAEFCKIIVEATGVSLQYPSTSNFPDVSTNAWFFTYVETAKANGWINGYPDGTFGPGNTLNRAEAAKIMSQAFRIKIPSTESNTWYQPYIDSLAADNLLAYGTTLQSPAIDASPTRSELFEQILRIMKHKKLVDVSVLPSNENHPKTETSTPVNTSQGGGSSSIPIPSLNSTPSANAGSIDIVKISPTQKINPNGSQTIEALSLNIKAKNAPVDISALQVRRIGNGSFADFTDIWLEVNGSKVSGNITPTDDIITIPFTTTNTIGKNSTSTYTIKVITDQNATAGSSRFVLYLPEWIEANTLEKTGFFPFGGVDILFE